MGRRQQQHGGRSEGDDRTMEGRDVEGAEDVAPTPIDEVEAAREVSRLLDRNEGYDRPEPRSVKRQNEV